MKIFKAKDYKNRTDLNFEIAHVRHLDKKEMVIKGTEEELRRLQLSPMTTVYGVPCEVTKETKKKK